MKLFGKQKKGPEKTPKWTWLPSFIYSFRKKRPASEKTKTDQLSVENYLNTLLAEKEKLYNLVRSGDSLNDGQERNDYTIYKTVLESLIGKTGMTNGKVLLFWGSVEQKFKPKTRFYDYDGTRSH